MDYDENNNMVRYRNELGDIYSYDQNRNLVQVIEPAGNTEQWTYNDLNKVTSIRIKWAIPPAIVMTLKGIYITWTVPIITFNYNQQEQVVEVFDQLANKTMC